MIKHVQFKKAIEIKKELATILNDCDLAYSAWIKDRNNTELFHEYRNFLKIRTEVIERYKSSYLIIK